MENRALEQAFRLGLGRAYLYVRDNGDKGVKDIILRHCLKNPCYDPQGEPARAQWLMSVVGLCKEPEFYADKIIEELSKTDDDRDLSQLYDLCLILAKNGNKSAEQAIYDRFDKQEFNESWLGGNQIIELHGLEGLTHVARVLGKRMLNDENYWDGAFIYSEACDTYEKEELDNLLSNLALTDIAIAEFLKDVSEHYRDQTHSLDLNSPEKLKERTRQELPLNKILDFIEDGQSHPSRCMRFGRHATDEEIDIIYKRLLTEKREEQLIRSLWVFRRRELPELKGEIFSLAHSDNKKLRGAAITALMHTSHSRVRDFAIELHDVEDVDRYLESIELFVNNYQSGDHRYIERALLESKDTEVLFSICYDILKVFEENPEKGMEKCLAWVFENTPCAHCRSRAVKLFFDNDIMPDDIRNECQFDCNEEIMSLVKSSLE